MEIQCRDRSRRWLSIAMSRPNRPGNARPVVDAISCPLTEVMTQTTLATAADVSPLRFEAYREMTDAELEQRIVAVKQQMGDSLLILGHHYQQDEVIRFADLRGDSFKLSQLAAGEPGLPRDRLLRRSLHGRDGRRPVPRRGRGLPARPGRRLQHGRHGRPGLGRGRLARPGRIIDTNDFMPVTYINSSADLKAFCGRHGGIVCTSSNARAVLDWAFSSAAPSPVLSRPAPGPKHGPSHGNPARPDDRLGPARTPGRQTPKRRSPPAGSCSGKATARSTRCSSPIMSSNSGSRFPDGKILVHPECMMQVVDAADLVGSTEFIIKTIRISPRRLDLGRRHRAAPGQSPGHENPDKTIHFLSPMVCMCATMYRIDLPHLAWCLENLARGTPVNRDQGPRRDGSLGTDRARAHARGDLNRQQVRARSASSLASRLRGMRSGR